MLLRVDLNCDLGEGVPASRDEAILDWVTSANIACGYHAGDHNVMRRTVELAASKGVGLGAHPGFPDREGFGRREMRFEPAEIFNMVIYQVGALRAFAHVAGVRLRHVKPHGALYNMAAREAGPARAIVDAVRAIDPELILFAPAASELVRAARRDGVPVAEEAFADRAYRPDGTLVPRTAPGAMIPDAADAAARAVRMVKEGRLTAIDGSELAIHADTICVHGDEPGALEFVKVLRAAFERHGIEVRRIGER
jgi:UPF0271 protein